MIGLSIIGGFRWYTPVPYWDMWIGYLGFYEKILNGGAFWWSQHSEHRIILARLLFYLDLSIFQGKVIFLIIVNYLLIASTCALFFRILKERLAEQKDIYARKILNYFILAILFSWIQRDNLIWGFQSQFILAQLLPLLAFFLLHRSFNSQFNSKQLFFLSCLTGLISLLSMANSILTLPLMTLFALLLGMKWQRVCTLALLACLCTIFYFYDYHTPEQHGDLKNEILSNPAGLLQFLLLYLGAPFYYISGKTSYLLGQLAGLFLIVSSTYFVWYSIKKPSNSSLQLAILFFLLYIGGSALATGGGRLIFGLEQAFTSRYQTPALMGWVALLILYAPAIAKGINTKPKLTLPILLLIALLFLPQQIKALHSQQDTLIEGWVAALALELDIKDWQQIALISPPTAVTYAIAKIAVDKDLSIFNHPAIKNVRQLFSKTVSSSTSIQCQGSMDGVSNIKGVSHYVRVNGWLFQGDNRESPEIIHILSNDRVVGYAFTGKARPDVKITVASIAYNSGFKGYMLSRYLGKSIVLRGYNPDCELKINGDWSGHT